MITVSTIITLLITGLIVGAIARLVVPGAQPVSVGMTVLLGMAGAFLAGLLNAYVLHAGPLVSFILAIAIAAGLVSWYAKRQLRRAGYYVVR